MDEEPKAILRNAYSHVHLPHYCFQDQKKGFATAGATPIKS